MVWISSFLNELASWLACMAALRRAARRRWRCRRHGDMLPWCALKCMLAPSRTLMITKQAFHSFPGAIVGVACPKGSQWVLGWRRPPPPPPGWHPTTTDARRFPRRPPCDVGPISLPHRVPRRMQREQACCCDGSNPTPAFALAALSELPAPAHKGQLSASPAVQACVWPKELRGSRRSGNSRRWRQGHCFSPLAVRASAEGCVGRRVNRAVQQ